MLRRGELLIWGGLCQSGRLSIVIGTTKFIKKPPICMREGRCVYTVTTVLYSAALKTGIYDTDLDVCTLSPVACPNEPPPQKDNWTRD